MSRSRIRRENIHSDAKEKRLRKTEIRKEIFTGDIWICPECNRKVYLIHVEPQRSHKFEKVIE